MSNKGNMNPKVVALFDGVFKSLPQEVTHHWEHKVLYAIREPMSVGGGAMVVARILPNPLRPPKRWDAEELKKLPRYLCMGWRKADDLENGRRHWIAPLLKEEYNSDTMREAVHFRGKKTAWFVEVVRNASCFSFHEARAACK